MTHQHRHNKALTRPPAALVPALTPRSDLSALSAADELGRYALQPYENTSPFP
jgi:hypothetical protein